MTYEPMFMLAILPMAAMGAAASLISDDAARWINGASKDIMDVIEMPGLWLMYEEVSSYAVVNQSPVSFAAPSNQSPMSPKKSAFTLSVNTNYNTIRRHRTKPRTTKESQCLSMWTL
jgi:hypothetical protein